MPNFICTQIPVDMESICPLTYQRQEPGSGHWSGHVSDAKETILHLREAIVQEKETILDQRETIRELTAKLSLCESFRHYDREHDHRGGTHPKHERDHDHDLRNGHGHDHSHNHEHSHEHGHESDHDEHDHDHDHDRSHGHESGHDEHDHDHEHGHLEDRNGHTPHYRDNGAKPSAAEYSLHHKETIGKHSVAGDQRWHTPYHHYQTPSKYIMSDEQRRYEPHHQEPSSKYVAAEEKYRQFSSQQNSGRRHLSADSPMSSPNDIYQITESLQPLKERLESLENAPNSSFVTSFREALQKRILEQQSQRKGLQNANRQDIHDYETDSEEMDSVPFNHTNASYNMRSEHLEGYDGQQGYKEKNLKTTLDDLQEDNGHEHEEKHTETFQVGFSLRTNYMYAKIKQSLPHEVFAFTICMQLRSSSSPGVGTPFSYSVPGQANELVLMEWGMKPMELLINDKAATLPLSINDAKWHHICVTWSTRDGTWEAYQDGLKRGSAENLAAWHPVKPGGMFILGQEQDAFGGRFDATQAFVGEIADFNMWDRVLSEGEIYDLSTCSGHMTGNLIAWTESAVELYGGISSHPINICP
ncbi:neuronal pentraxin-1-like [Protopterus annectens]|uniref:neuronal pentraxin-1-like n=1 Tax=Protopterus annectens TaxID=7888 RepID=UPI001CFBDCFD|nr:neuronal pentraxin-1-like [Protopterus annectens]